MRLVCVVALACAALSSVTAVAGCSGCREEPTIVIKFEPQDLSGQAPRAATPMAAVVDAGSSAAAKPAPTATSKAPTAAEIGPCKSDADCVAAPAECCDCNNGGALVAVLKTAAKARAARCGDVMCTAMMSTDPSCAQVAACVKGSCALVAPKNPKKKEK